VVGSDYAGTQAVTITTPTATPKPTTSLDTVTAQRAVCTS